MKGWQEGPREWSTLFYLYLALQLSGVVGGTSRSGGVGAPGVRGGTSHLRQLSGLQKGLFP